jgi:NitT/TauT family transport system ATP-binding protein
MTRNTATDANVAATDVAPLIRVDTITKTFATLDGPLPVLDGVSLDVHPGEVVALLGKSGSGKSTLLRCIAGLIRPSAGEVRLRGTPVDGPNPGTAMVFQSFALLPWLTVQQNVELGLEAQGVEAAERAQRAVSAIDLIGLDGFESAYPKELSGGMRQRVGFARALVVEPEVLLMDEPFSALDVLTAENLRGELLELWGNSEFPIKAIVIVTHNIEEAVILADRIVVLGSNPGRIKAELAVSLKRPRDRNSSGFAALVEQIYAIMTGRPDPVASGAAAPAKSTLASVPLPHATVDGLSGLAEMMQQLGSITMAELADEFDLEVDDLLPLVDALELLGFAAIDDGRIHLTAEGCTFAGADIQASKQIFATQAMAHLPLVRVMLNSLAHVVPHTLGIGFFLQLLRRSFSDAQAQRQLEVAIDWGRYAELYSFDADHHELALDPDRLAREQARR